MEPSGRVGFVAALAAEAKTLGPARRVSGGGRSGGGGGGGGGGADGLRVLTGGSLLAVSGMGLDAAERSARALVSAGCGALVSWGLAGGLDPALSAGMIAIPALVMMLEGGGAEGAAEASDRAADLNTSADWCGQVVESLRRAGSVAVGGGRLLTSRRPLASAAEKRKAFLETGAVAVDMESYAIASVAAAHGLPFIAIRVIVDAAEDEVPAFLLDAADSRGRIAVARVLMRTVVSPRSLAPLLRLSRRYGVARRALREAACVFGRRTG